MVTVPFVCPDAPALKNNPVFMYYPDRFQKPNPFQPDVVVAIDAVIEKKLDALAVMESQFLEGGANGYEGLIPKNATEREKRVREVRAAHAGRNQSLADRLRKDLIEWYGNDRGDKVRHAEAFEVCEYGRRPDKAELRMALR